MISTPLFRFRGPYRNGFARGAAWRAAQAPLADNAATSTGVTCSTCQARAP